MKLSIITPSFNQAPFLPRTLESVASQTHAEIEHIIQDAGSSDGSLEIFQNYAAGKEKVRLVVERDAGQADAINRGLQLATGDFLCWLNTDDYYEAPDVVATVARAFEENPDADVVYGRGDFVAPTGETLRTAYIHTDPENLTHHLVRSVGILQPALFFRASLLHRAGLVDTEMSCAFDHELWTRFVAAGAKFHFLDRKLVNATFHQDAKSSRLRRTQILESAEVSRRYYSFASAEWITRSVEFDLTGRNQIFDQKNRPLPSEEQKAQADQISEARFRAANSSNSARFAIISAPDLTQYSKSRKLAHASGLVETNRVIATTFDDAYLEQGLTLIRSIRAHQGARAPIVVYDLNLSSESKHRIAALANVHLASYPRDAVDSFPGFLYPKNYSYKCVAIRDAARFVEEGGTVLWIDAGVAPISSLEPIYDIIREAGVFFVDHDDKADWPFYNGSFCHPRAAEALGASAGELFGEHLCSCLLGYRKGGPFQVLFEEADRYARIEEAVIWSKHPALSTTEGDFVPPKKSQSKLSQELASRPAVLKALPPSQTASVLGYFGHRQDQTIFSILAARYGAPIQSATRFCRSDDASSKVSKLNWASQSAWKQIQSSSEIPPHMEGAVTYHHRGIYQRTDAITEDRPTSRQLLLLSPGLQAVEHIDGIAINRQDSKARYYIHTEDDLSPTLEEDILQREVNGIELFVLRDKVIAALSEEVRRLSCIWNLDKLRALVPEIFLQQTTPEGDAALVGAMLGYTQLVLPSATLPSEALAVLADLNVQVLKDVPAVTSPVLLDDNLRPIYVPIPQVISFDEGIKRLLSPDCTFLHIDASTDLAELCWEQAKPGMIQYSPLDAWHFQPGLLLRHGYTIYLIKDQAKAGYRIHPPYETLIRAREGTYGGDWQCALAFQRDPGLDIVRKAFQEDIPLPCPSGMDVEINLIPAQPREAQAHVDELTIVHKLLGEETEKVLISAGADRKILGSSFLSFGWKVLALVNDAGERSYLNEKYRKEIAQGQLILDGRSASNKIESLAPSAPIADLMQEHGLPAATVLHVDNGGMEREALDGFPWRFCSPAVVLCFAEEPARIQHFLRDRGYRVFLSEWHPILQQGVPQQWKSLREVPFQEAAAHGVTIGLRADISIAQFVELFKEQLAPPPAVPRIEAVPIVEETPVLAAEEKEPEKTEKPALPKTEPREFRAGTKTTLRNLFLKQKPLVLALMLGIAAGSIALFFFAGAIAAVLWILATVSLALNALAIHRQDQTEFALRSALGDVALLKDKVADLRTRTNGLESRSESLERKGADIELRARKLESLTASTKRNVDVLEDLVDVGVKDLDEKTASLQLQSEIDRKNIDKLTAYRDVLRTLPGGSPDLSQPRSRVLSELSYRTLQIWAARLDLEVNRRSLSHLAHRVTELEMRSIGRLDIDLETAVLQLLVLKTLTGGNVRTLEIGGLFGIGLAMQFECCLGDFASINASSVDPLHGREKGPDYYTLQTVSRRVIENNLLRAGAAEKEISILDTLDSSVEYDLVSIYGGAGELLVQVASIVRAGGYVLIAGDDAESSVPQLELIGRDFGLSVFRKAS